jgi:hypothetical protein
MGNAPAWRLAAHPLFLEQLRRLAVGHRPLSTKAEQAHIQVLAMISALCLYIIPAGPMRPEFEFTAAERQFAGDWRRAYFGAKRFMLLFRVLPATRAIVFGCITDLEASGYLAENANPIVLFEHVCPITAAGRISLPRKFMQRLGINADSRVVLHNADLLQSIFVQPVEAATPPQSRMVFQPWAISSSPAPKQTSIYRAESKTLAPPMKRLKSPNHFAEARQGFIRTAAN